MEKKKPFIIITGPTAVGKTGISIDVAKSLGGSIISADSMQVYRHMDIGSNKIKASEMQGIPHYLVDALEPSEEFNVVRFQQMAKEALQEIYEENRIPIIVGGTGFYIQALLYDIDFTESEEEPAYRRELESLAAEKGTACLHEMLRKVDPVSAEMIHANNVKRTIRALEFYHQTGGPISLHNETQKEKESPYDYRFFCLTDDREKIYEKIDRRVDEMLDEGLVREVRLLKEMGYTKDMVSMQGLGYKEILDYLQGASSLSEAVYLIKRDTRRYAKRQLTWFRRERDVIWVDKRDYSDRDALVRFILDQCREIMI